MLIALTMFVLSFAGVDPPPDPVPEMLQSISMDAVASLPQLVALAKSSAWVPFAAIVVGFLTRATKEDVPWFFTVDAKYRPLIAILTGSLAAVLAAQMKGTPWPTAIAQGLLAAVIAIAGHGFFIEKLAGGKELPMPFGKKK